MTESQVTEQAPHTVALTTTDLPYYSHTLYRDHTFKNGRESYCVQFTVTNIERKKKNGGGRQKNMLHMNKKTLQRKTLMKWR